MITKLRYLTKSRFKLGLECPVKLFYTGKDEYKDAKKDDPFMEALAEGGFQVGELAKYKYPNGTNIETLDYDEALTTTNKLLTQEEVTIYEPAIKFEDLFIRVDVLKQSKNHIEIIEVKAKSYEQKDLEKDPFLLQKGGISSEWAPYLYDIAFQYYVTSKAFPNKTIIPKLLLVDKSKEAVTDGLNQKFKLGLDVNKRKKVYINGEFTEKDLENDLLKEIPVKDYIGIIYETPIEYGGVSRTFENHIKYLAEIYKNNQKANIHISKSCKSCEFKTKMEDEQAGLKSGFKECWSSACDWTEEDFTHQNLFDIWDNRKVDSFISERKLKINDFCAEDFLPQKASIKKKPGLDRAERQWLQIEKAQNNDSSPHLDKASMQTEMSSWKYPLHFIDFETSMVAIPFNTGMRPYEQIAFQFSHHKVHKDGSIEHLGQFLHDKSGVFPNFEFVRALRKDLNTDTGTIFRYSSHENTVLNKILEQIKNSSDLLEDKQELIDFILSITHQKDARSNIIREGNRNMVDLFELVKQYYYHPYMKGSNSIKYVLPAILNSSDFLKEKYSKPIYGATEGIKSLNFTDKAWIELDEQGMIKDPYQNLPPLFEKYSHEELEDLDLFSNDTQLANGAAAMAAYAKMQFTEMSDIERQELKTALLKYCELDTLAMVMIYEGWREMVK